MKTLTVIALSLLVFILPAAAQSAGVTTVTWHGHAAFSVKTPGGALLLIDPWLTNPKNPAAEPLAAAAGADYILITHGHQDHVGDAIAIGKKTGARLIAQYELGALLKAKGFPARQTGMDTLMNIGGEIILAGGEVRVAMVPALHSGGMSDAGGGFSYAGTPCGYVITITGGPTVYHAGDTGYSAEMAAIGRLYRPDLALLPVGGHFNMTARAAAMAAEDLGARWTVPMHFATFPLLATTPDGFVRETEKRRTMAVVLRPGQSLKFMGAKLVR